MRLGLDATPLLGPTTGVGRYTRSLLAALAGGPEELVATAFTARGRLGRLPGVRVRGRPVPARLLQQAWSHAESPPVEWLTGPLDVFHATNFVLPPTRRARGVVTVHDLAYLHHADTVTAASLRYRALVPRSIERAAAVVTPSEAVAGQVRDAYDPAVPVVAVPHGVDPEWSEPPGQSAVAGPYVLFVGTLEPRKDVATLLAAHALVPGAPPLVLAGLPGWGPAPDLSGATVLGHLADRPLRALVASASVLVLPSRDEGFGLPVLEALACGTPVVASDLPVLREVGGDVVTYAAVGDPEEFAAALAAVLEAPGPAAPRRARAAQFTWARSAAGHRAVYAAGD